jgi:tRNA(Ile)-lysidine synthase
VPANRHTFAPGDELPSRSDAASRAVVAAWRRLTASEGWTTARTPDADRRTLVACSGGADSAALAICLAGASAGARRSVVLGHVVHDLRPASLALADRDRARGLALRLGVEFVEREVRVVAMAGNAEANARRARYAALVEMAREAGCPFVATAHHADDQLETLLMRLVRGSGLRGLACIHASRRLAEGVRLVRPMLVARREDSLRICALAGYEPAVDATNADTTRLRAALRAGVLPVLEQLNRGVAAHAVEIAMAAREAQSLVRRRALGLVHLERAESSAISGAWLDVGEVREAGELVAAEAIVLAARRVSGEPDLAMPRRRLAAIVRAVWSGRPRVRTFRVRAGSGDLVGTLSAERLAWRLEART